MPTVTALHTAPATRLPMRSVDRVEAAEAFGAPVPAALTQRNVTISDGDVPTVPGTRIRVGGALLEAVRVAAPCKLLDDTIGAGAQGALRRRAGTVFRVLESGQIAVGDEAVLDAS